MYVHATMYTRKFLRLQVKAEGTQGDKRSRVACFFCSDVQLLLPGEAVGYECVYAYGCMHFAASCSLLSLSRGLSSRVKRFLVLQDAEM
jgi:hypothetical protein